MIIGRERIEIRKVRIKSLKQIIMDSKGLLHDTQVRQSTIDQSSLVFVPEMEHLCGTVIDTNGLFTIGSIKAWKIDEWMIAEEIIQEDYPEYYL